NRATLLYERVCNNLKEIDRLGADCNGSLRSRYRHRAKIRRQYSKELDDLRAYAHHLRAMIIRIRGRPLQRFRSWAHTVSSRSAFSYALALYVLILALAVRKRPARRQIASGMVGRGGHKSAFSHW